MKHCLRKIAWLDLWSERFYETNIPFTGICLFVSAGMFVFSVVMEDLPDFTFSFLLLVFAFESGFGRRVLYRAYGKKAGMLGRRTLVLGFILFTASYVSCAFQFLSGFGSNGMYLAFCPAEYAASFLALSAMAASRMKLGADDRMMKAGCHDGFISNIRLEDIRKSEPFCKGDWWNLFGGFKENALEYDEEKIEASIAMLRFNEVRVSGKASMEDGWLVRFDIDTASAPFRSGTTDTGKIPPGRFSGFRFPGNSDSDDIMAFLEYHAGFVYSGEIVMENGMVSVSIREISGHLDDPDGIYSFSKLFCYAEEFSVENGNCLAAQDALTNFTTSAA